MLLAVHVAAVLLALVIVAAMLGLVRPYAPPGEYTAPFTRVLSVLGLGGLGR